MLTTRRLINPDNDIAEQGIKALAAAVVIQAAREAKKGDPDARAWLMYDGLTWCEAVGYDLHPDTVKKWLKHPKIPARNPRHSATSRRTARGKKNNTYGWLR